MTDEFEDTVPDEPPPQPGDMPSDGLPADLSSLSNLHQYPIPAATPENFVCMRGPCRHYWYLQTDAQAGNVKGTFESMGVSIPRRHRHICTLNPAQETEFQDDAAYECSRWEPLTRKELTKISKRRAEFQKENR